MTSTAKLRQYQGTAVSAVLKVLRPNNSVILVAPTGAGKTIMAARIARRFTRVLFVAHRVEIIEQSRKDFRKTVQCQSVSAALRRRDLKQFDLLIIDECHRSGAPTYQELIKKCVRASLLGLTATPLRMDGQGLCRDFDEIVECPSPKELIDLGWLVPSRILVAPDEALRKLESLKRKNGDYQPGDLAFMGAPRLIGNVVREYREHGRGRKAIVFAVSIAHSKALAEAFRAEGIKAAHLDGRASEDARRQALSSLAAGRIKVLCSVNLFTEGWDCPAVSCVIMARPTQSLTLYLQSIGRGMRPHPGKKDLLILDHAGNVDRLGHPEIKREWTLQSAAQIARADREVAELERIFALGYSSMEEYRLGELRRLEESYSAAECEAFFGNRGRTQRLFAKHSIRPFGGSSASRYWKSDVDPIRQRFGIAATFTPAQCEELLREFTDIAKMSTFLHVMGVKSVKHGLYRKNDIVNLRDHLRESRESNYSPNECMAMFGVSGISTFFARHGIRPTAYAQWPKDAVDSLKRRLDAIAAQSCGREECAKILGVSPVGVKAFLAARGVSALARNSYPLKDVQRIAEKMHPDANGYYTFSGVMQALGVSPHRARAIIKSAGIQPVFLSERRNIAYYPKKEIDNTASGEAICK